MNDSFSDSGSHGVIQTTQSTTQTTQSATQLMHIIALMKMEPELSQKKIAERLKLNVNTVKYYVRIMQEQGVIEHVGSSRKGKWVVKQEVKGYEY